MNLDENQILATNQPIWLHKLNIYNDMRREGAKQTWNSEANNQTDSLVNELGPLFERWTLSFSDNSKSSSTPNSILISMTALCSKNGFKQITEVSASHFRDEIYAVKQTWDIHELQPESDSCFKIGPCSFHYDSASQTGHTQGTILSKGQEFKWDLTFKPRHSALFQVIPKTLRHPSLRAITVGEDFLFSGTTWVAGKSTPWTSAPGKQSHVFGNRNFKSWVWAHCNTFSESGEKVIVEAFTTQGDGPSLLRDRLLPNQTSIYIYYQNKEYRLNSIWTALRTRFKRSPEAWEFWVEAEDLKFSGKWTINATDLVGQTLEDTDGALLNLSQTGLAQCELLIYRKGKLETSLHSDRKASIEFATTRPNPYLKSRF